MCHGPYANTLVLTRFRATIEEQIRRRSDMHYGANVIQRNYRGHLGRVAAAEWKYVAAVLLCSKETSAHGCLTWIQAASSRVAGSLQSVCVCHPTHLAWPPVRADSDWCGWVGWGRWRTCRSAVLVGTKSSRLALANRGRQYARWYRANRDRIVWERHKASVQIQRTVRGMIGKRKMRDRRAEYALHTKYVRRAYKQQPLAERSQAVSSFTGGQFACKPCSDKRARSIGASAS